MECVMFLRASVLGLVLAVCAIAGLHWPLRNEVLNRLALFLAFTACVYPGALLAQRAAPWATLAEIAIGLGVLACAWLGVTHDPLWIVVGYLVHGIWDWGHHAKRIPTRIKSWFPPACAAFDIAVAGYSAWIIL